MKAIISKRIEAANQVLEWRIEHEFEIDQATPEGVDPIQWRDAFVRERILALWDAMSEHIRRPID